MKKKSTQARIAANQSNAQLSSGPATPAGKARSSQNARKFRGAQYTVIRFEEPDDVTRYRTDFIESYKPQNLAELRAIEIMAQANQDLDRAYRLKAGILSAGLGDMCDSEGFLPILPESIRGDVQLTRDQNNTWAVAKGIAFISRKSDGVQLVLRWAANADRDLRHAEDRFFHLRDIRKSLDADPESPYLGTEPEKAPQNEPKSDIQPEQSTELTSDEKRTQTGPWNDPADPEAYGYVTGDSSISGVITDHFGPAEGAAVGIICNEMQLYCAVTGSDGKYHFPRLPAGNYLLSLIKPSHIETMPNSGFMYLYAKNSIKIKLEPGEHLNQPLHHRSTRIEAIK